MQKSVQAMRSYRPILWSVLFAIPVVAITVWLRLDEGFPPLAGLDSQELVFDSDNLGLALQELFIPLIGLYVLSSTALFERLVTTFPIHNSDRIKLSAILVVILLLNIIAVGWFNLDYDGLVTNGMLIILVGALLGGWRTGTMMAVATMLIYVIHLFLLELPPQPLDSAQNALSSFLNVLWWSLLDLSLITMLWTGIVVGLWRDAAGAQIWKPLWLFIIGALFEWFPAWLNYFVTGNAELVLEHLPVALITGFVLMVVGLLARQAQARTAEKHLVSSEHARMQAELKALRTQINPHFLFNALSTIRYHARTEPDTAYDLLDDLSDMFHGVLKADAFVSIEEELDMVKAYLAIEKARLRERLSVIWQIDDTIDLHHPIPTLIVQPLVENAVVHGIGPRPQGGVVTITVQSVANAYQLCVADDGLGFDIGDLQTNGTGIGLSNVQERMISLYGPDFAPVIESSAETGTSITLRIPR